MKKTLKTLMVIAGLAQGTAIFAACDQVGYEDCLTTRRECWNKIPAGANWEIEAQEKCDKPFEQCAIDRGCKDAAMETIKIAPAEVEPAQ